MRTLPALIILVIALLGGRFLGLEWAAGSVDKAALEAHKTKLREEATELVHEEARGLALRHFERLQKRLNEESVEAAAARKAALEEGQVRLDRMEEIMSRTEETVESLAATMKEKMSPGDYYLAKAAIALRSDDFYYGKTLIQCEETVSRRQGVRHLALAAAKGNLEAVELLMSLFNDQDQSVAQEAIRSAAGLARKDDAERKALFVDSGLEDRLVSMLAGLDGSSERRVLDALTELENPAASQAWRQIFNDVDARGRDQVTAARALKDLGSNTEYNQLVIKFEADLKADDRRAMRSAVNDLRRLGGDEAKAALQRALDADPDGENADTIRRTLSRFDRQFGGIPRFNAEAPNATGPDPTRRVRAR